jgi:hypothetical protein
LLLGFLFSAGLPDWPGADGMTLDAVLSTYAGYAAVARVPDRQCLLLWYPELREEIADFFTRTAK